MRTFIPDGIDQSLWSWADRTRSAHGSGLLKTLYREESIPLVQPKGQERPVPPSLRELSVHVPKAGAAVLPEGRLWISDNGIPAIITPDNRLLWEESMQFRGPKRGHPIFRKHALPPPVHMPETVAVLIFAWARNYYHWFGDVLARVHLFRKYGIKIDKYVVKGEKLSRFQEETLAMLGISRRQIVFGERGLHVKAAKLVVPSWEMYDIKPHSPHSFPGWASRFLREKLGQPRPAKGGLRIYVSRGDAKRRKVTNEKEVETLLSGYGFRSVLLGELPVAEQIRLFGSADVVVAPHGAGLTNVLFCRPGTRVIELFAPRYVNPVYWYLCSQAGLDYGYSIGKGERPPNCPGIGSVRRLYDPITVDLQALAGTLELLGVRR